VLLLWGRQLEANVSHGAWLLLLLVRQLHRLQPLQEGVFCRPILLLEPGRLLLLLLLPLLLQLISMPLLLQRRLAASTLLLLQSCTCE
jgi:hypothetical protein